MNTYNECEYIKKQYIQQGVLDKDGDKFELDFDFGIYPWESGYIPKCAVCQEMYNKYNDKKENKVTALHRSCGCLWFEWFKQRLLNINPQIIFV
jgi:hypothetical protein